VSTPGMMGSSGDDRFTVMQTVETLRNENRDICDKLETLKGI